MRKNKSAVRMVTIAAVVIGIVVAGVLYMARTDDDVVKPRITERKAKLAGKRKGAAKQNRPVIRKSTSKKIGEKPQFDFDSKEHPYSDSDKRLARAMQEALDADDYEAVMRTTAEALKAENPDVRHNAVEALGWYGVQALPELTVCMADKDEDVAQAAMNHWEEGVAEMDDAEEKLQISLYAINTLSDVDTLTMMSSHFAGAAIELIDGEENPDMAAQKRLEVVQALVDVIEGENEKSADAAREAYDEITGSPWVSIEEAEKYLGDPENYEAPDSNDNGGEQVTGAETA